MNRSARKLDFSIAVHKTNGYSSLFQYFHYHVRLAERLKNPTNYFLRPKKKNLHLLLWCNAFSGVLQSELHGRNFSDDEEIAEDPFPSRLQRYWEFICGMWRIRHGNFAARGGNRGTVSFSLRARKGPMHENSLVSWRDILLWHFSSVCLFSSQILNQKNCSCVQLWDRLFKKGEKRRHRRRVPYSDIRKTITPNKPSLIVF